MSQHVVEYAVLALFAGIIFWRVILPNLRLVSKKPGAGAIGATAPIVLTPGTTGSKSMKERLKDHLWTVVLAVVGLMTFYFWLYKPGIRLSEVGTWSWDHWVALPLFFGIVWALIKLNEMPLGELAGLLKSGALLALFLVFLGIPAGIWVRDVFLPQAICKDVSAHETRSCVLNTAWSSWIKAAEGPSVDGMQVCFTPGGKFEREIMNGTSFWRFKADEGKLVKTYRLYPGNTACPLTVS